MAAPKKRTSKSRKNMRKSTWKRQAATQAKKALSLAKSIATGKSTIRGVQSNLSDES
uniref:Large ribosomal subunit protein bL32c n=1 Tax=Mesostigma viride TaxID=41882 RepID=RK32_MESVI|nr:ribosomal protein L32 [Mesostigma viride]Q9MUL8.1 RecName: Full=Large ribosomal subunit protein bL32c; AltName: Full=50S ribosomal protein L32, chloroplastic [Mesostigma viride]AAF43880.1 ribosomal protein L32 [Mesostigma viride]WKT08283.1 ribosomal protein L32 [Mesostigma viride]WKT08389.1 ribosomal protein L32 [Mesostigma viride]